MRAEPKTTTLKQVTENLDNILQKRNGGATNFRGIHFQILYACYLILQELKKDAKTKFIQLEGIEDIDLHTSQTITIDSEYIQLKSSVNKMDAGTFWGLGVLQNFLEVYEKNPDSRFKLVYNMKIADGNLSTLISKRQGQPLSKYWIDKLETLS
ncbi:dsDNA nuclease domain-containing protein [Sphingobacterium sp. lm-10]|uniref:dsDNA nuclease domain-containing protein n=1 Tax=Sphingobacterium sp. lm-10 TaxID=2944904 RepID=UPI00202057C9|nr:dsDNA nuclease domain-containing protein [Sphingobacterium sp. lm-10]MCL7988304.1 dsDNA nuclease domain-containing protein [Sphingobacterium sp. lm-10]